MNVGKAHTVFERYKRHNKMKIYKDKETLSRESARK